MTLDNEVQDKFARIVALSQAIEKAKRIHARSKTYETAQAVQTLTRQRDELRATMPKLKVVE